MKRRTCLKAGAAALGSVLLYGCERRGINTDDQLLDLPPFSPSRLRASLDGLLAAYLQKGLPVTQSLLPPIEPAALQAACDWFPGELTPQLVTLYGWRGGQKQDSSQTEYTFRFRDMSFLSIARARFEYRSMMSSYGMTQADRDLLKYCFPFASFGGGWYVLPTRGHSFNASLPMPVLSVFADIDVYFYSMETMVNTCIDWVSHPEYQQDAGLPRDLEMEIWRRHNPGIFA